MSQKMAQVEALQNPYLVLNICEHLQDNLGTLQIAAQLNQTWFAEAIKVLWRQPPLKALASLPAERRELYSIRVHKLVFGADDLPYHYAIKDACFKSLSSVSMGMNRAMYWPSDYLQGSLQELEVVRSVIPKTFFGRLDQCPRLHTLKLGPSAFCCTKEEAHSANLERFLKGSASMRSLGLEDDHLLSDELFFVIAGHERLATLSIRDRIGCALWGKLLDSEVATFRCLRELHLRVPTAAVPLLVRCLNPNTLHVLRLDLKPGSLAQHKVLRSVAMLSHLTSLYVTFKDGSPSQALSLRELLSIRNISLTSLTLYGTKAKALDLTDEHFESWISSFPELRRFVFGARNKLSTIAVCLVAKHCRYLEHCGLETSLDLQGLSSLQMVAFPELKGLVLSCARPVLAER